MQKLHPTTYEDLSEMVGVGELMERRCQLEQYGETNLGS